MLFSTSGVSGLVKGLGAHCGDLEALRREVSRTPRGNPRCSVDRIPKAHRCLPSSALLFVKTLPGVARLLGVF